MEHTKIKWEPYYRSNTCVQSLFQMCANLEIVCIQSKIVSNFGKLNEAGHFILSSFFLLFDVDI